MINIQADIIISAIGQPLYITKDFIDPEKKPVLIDIGVNYIEKDNRMFAPCWCHDNRDKVCW